jgi:lipase maturation factor 1
MAMVGPLGNFADWLLAPEDVVPPLRWGWPARRVASRFGASVPQLEPAAEVAPALHLLPRWLFLRALAIIYFSAFYSLVFQIHGLIGPDGILPAGDYLKLITEYLGVPQRYAYAPTLLWLGSGPRALGVLCWAGLLASVLLFFNLWPRGMLVVCFLAFLSFAAAAQDFAGYQSDGMLLSAGFLSFFFAPPGLRPRWGAAHPPSRFSLFLLQWLWFRIYFESGVVKLLSGDQDWRRLTAMDEYYQNGPLPTWIGWYVQHLPHRFHVATAGATLLIELVLVWMLFLPRRARILCFLIVTPWELGVILTANYAFLNYLVLALGVLLVDDGFASRVISGVLRRLPATWRGHFDAAARSSVALQADWLQRWRTRTARRRMAISGILLSWVFYATTAGLLLMIFPGLPLPKAPLQFIEPLCIAEGFGLFAVMTHGRYEIEFQGSNDDGRTWTAYAFRYKPQDVTQAPGIYAPYQPRFDWNLWFASLGSWRDYPYVPRAEERLLEGSPAVLALFAGNPFPAAPPKQLRAVLWQYWFTDLATKKTQGLWWRRAFLGVYGPTLERKPDGEIVMIDLPVLPLHHTTP